MNQMVAIAARLAQTIVKTTLIDSIRDGVVDFLTDQTKDLGKKEISDRITQLRSDARLRSQIQQARARAVKRWASDHHDRDLVAAVAQSTTFTDLPSVQEAMRAVAQNPFNPIAAKTLWGKFDHILPPRFELVRVEQGISSYWCASEFTLC